MQTNTRPLELPSLPSWVDLSDLRASDNFFILIRKQDKHKEAKEKVLFWSKRKQKHFHPFEVFLSRIKMELLEFCSGPLMFKMIWNILKGWSESRYFDVLKSGISDERLNDGSHHNQRPCYWFYIIVFKYCYVSTVVRSKESPNKYLLTWPRHSIQSKVFVTNISSSQNPFVLGQMPSAVFIDSLGMDFLRLN